MFKVEREREREKGVRDDSHDKSAHAYTRYCRTATRKIITGDQKTLDHFIFLYIERILFRRKYLSSAFNFPRNLNVNY